MQLIGIREGVDIDALVEVVLNAMEAAEDEAQVVEALRSQADNFRTIAKACESTRMFLRAKDQIDASLADFDAKTPPADRLYQAWTWMAQNIIEAPTLMHMGASIRMCMVVMDRYLTADAATQQSEIV